MVFSKIAHPLRLLATTCSLACCVFVEGKPTGFHLKEGAAVLRTEEGTNAWIESGAKAWIDWDSFSIDLKEAVHFQQEGPGSYVLNCVVGSEMSQLLGSLSSNGAVYLINPNGILIGSEAHIQTAGFLASTLDLLDIDFTQKGELRFAGASEKEVVNWGKIECPIGDVFLIGQTVENHGTIATPEGRQGLLSGCDVWIRPAGAPQVQIRAEEIDTVLLQENPYAVAIRHSGNSTAKEVYLHAVDGTAEVSGQIVVRDGDKGGHVRILGDTVGLLSGAKIDASGRYGGGEVLIGGDYQGKNPEVQNARYTWVGTNTEVRADALEQGEGGKVIFWGDKATTHYGKVWAQGGAEGGNGGFVEISGKFLDYQGLTTTLAPLGKAGTLLLDPINITISASADSANVTFVAPNYQGTGGTPCSPSPANIDSAALSTNLDAGNVTISTNATNWSGCVDVGSIVVSDAVSWSMPTTLTLTAASYINITAAITNTSSSMTPFTAMNFTSSGTGAAANPGIRVAAALTTGNMVSGAEGEIILTGTGGASTGSHGVQITTGGMVSTQNGPISITGTSSGGVSSGVVMGVTNGLRSASGTITISGNATTMGTTGAAAGVTFSTSCNALGANVVFQNCLGGGTGGGAHGVNFSAGTFTTTGNVTFRNCVGGPAGASHGINVAGAITISGNLIATDTIQARVGTTTAVGYNQTASVTAGGYIHIIAQSFGTLGSAAGISLQAGTISTSTGTLTLEGTAGPSTTGSSFGLSMFSTGRVLTTSGDITLKGTATASTLTCIGASLAGPAVDFVKSTSGNITITGTSSATGMGSSGASVGAAWTPGTTGTVEFLNCSGSPSGSTSHGVVIFSALTTAGPLKFTNCSASSASGNGINVGAAAVSSAGGIEATCSATGTGGIGFFSNQNITVSGANNPITISATASGTTGACHGISLTASTMSTTGGGSITLTGSCTLSTSTTASHGINLSGTATITTATGGGGIKLTGHGSSGNSASYGINMAAGTGMVVTSAMGSITLTGIANSTAASSHGVALSAWTPGAAGTIAFSGCTGSNTGAGVNFGGAFTGSGDVTFTTCTGGSAGGNGVTVGTAAFTTTGNVNGTGLAGAGAGGVGFSSNQNFSVTGVNQGINISASASGVTLACHGISLTAGTMSTTMGGSITLVGDASMSTSTTASHGINLSGTGVISASGAGSITLTGTGSSGNSTSFGINMAAGTGMVISGSGTISLAGVTTSSGASSHGVSVAAAWTPATSGLITFSTCTGSNTGAGVNFGGAFTGSGGVTFTTCTGGSAGGNGVNIGAAFTTTGNVSGTGLTGAGAGGVGFSSNQNFSVSGSSQISITASASGTTGACHGISLTGGTMSSASGTITLNGISGMSSSASHGINLASAAAAITSTSGAIQLSGTSTAIAAGSHGVSASTAWAPATSGLITFSSCTGSNTGAGVNFGGAFTGSGGVTFTTCTGGSAGGNGVNIGAAFTTTGNVSGTGLAGAGAGGVGFSSNQNFSVSGSSQISITASASGTTGDCHGISLTGGTMSSASGTITLNGLSGMSSSASHGINLASAAAAITSTSGAIQLSGTSTAIAAGSHGVSASTAWAPATSGLITFSSCTGSNTGAGVNFGGAFTGSGDVTFTTCTGGSAGGNGVNIGAAFTTTGNVSGTGLAGAGAGGVGFSSSQNFSVSGSSQISITASASGTTGACHGIALTGGTMSTNSGTITLIGTSGMSNASSYGVVLSSLNPIASVTGTISVTGTSQSTPSGSHGIAILNSWDAGTTRVLTLTGSGAVSAGSYGIDIENDLANSGPITLSGLAGSFGNFLGGNITTVGEDITIGGSNLLSGSRTIDTTNMTPTGADIIFSGTIDGASAYMDSLNLQAGTAGSVTFSGAIGGGAMSQLGAIDVVSATTSPDAVNIGANITAADFTITTASPVTLLGNSHIDTSGSAGGSILFPSTVDGTHDLTLSANAAGSVTFLGNVGTTAPIEDLLITSGDVSIGAMVTDIQASSFTTQSSVPVTLNNTNPLVIATTGNIAFGGTIDGASAYMNDLTLQAGMAGAVTFSGAIGAGAMSQLGVIDVSAKTTANAINIGANITAADFTITTASPVTLLGNSHIDTSGSPGASISFPSTVNGTYTLTLSAETTGSVTFSGNVGSLLSLGPIIINQVADVTVSGSMTATSLTQVAGTGTTLFNGPLSFTADSSLTGTIFTFNASTNSTGGVSIANAGLLTISSAGDMTLGGAFAQSGAGLVDIGADIAADDGISFASDVTLTDNVSLTTDASGNIDFAQTINGTSSGAQALTLAAGSTGTATLSGNVGSISIPLGPFVINSGELSIDTGVTSIWATSFTTQSSVPVTLNNTSPLVITTTGDIAFGGTISGASALTLDAPGNDITFSGNVGTPLALGPILITQAADVTASGSMTATSLTQAAGTGTTIFNGPLSFTGDISLTGTAFTFNASVNSADDVSITNAGLLTISSAGDMSLSGTFAQLGAGLVDIGADIAADDDISFASDVTLIDNASLTTGASGNIDFAQTINGNRALIVSADNITFHDTVGNGTPLSSLQATASSGTITIYDDQTVGTGPMSYTGPVALMSATTLTNNGSSPLSFSSSISGNYDLTLQAPSTSITVGGDIDLSGTTGSTGSASGVFTATASTGATFSGQILTLGGEGTSGAGGAGGNVVISCSDASVSVHNINASGGDGTASGGTAGDITLSGASGYAGDYPIGLIVLNSDLSMDQAGNLVATPGSGGGGTGGAVTLSSNRTDFSTVATITSSSAGNNLFVVADSFEMGPYEAMTILGDIEFQVTSEVTLGDTVALGSLSIFSVTTNLNIHGPIQLLASSGQFYESPTLHFLSGGAYVNSGTLVPPGPLNAESLGLPPSTFRPFLFYSGHILNFDSDAPPPPVPPAPPTPSASGFLFSEISFLLYRLSVADAQLSDSLPIYELDCNSIKKRCRHY